MVSYFKYICRLLSSLDGDSPAVVANIGMARKKLAQISCILGREGVEARMLGIFYKAAVEAVLLFGSYKWVVNLRIVRKLV